MKNTITWGKLLGAAAIVAVTAAGCGNDAANEADGTPDAIESPVMDKEDDQAISGGDSSADATGNAATGTTDAADNAATGTTDNTATGDATGTTDAAGTTDATANTATDAAGTTDATAPATE